MYIDSHCHIDDEKIIDKNNAVKSAIESGVDIMINMACNANSCQSSMELASQHKSIYFGVGYHPEYVEEFSEKSIDFILDYVTHNKCVCMGEIGLDYHYDGFDKHRQIQMFLSFIELANQVKLPISIHSRDATEDMIKILKENKSKLSSGFVMHCFSGSRETAKTILDLGGYISFGGTVTFKNAVNIKEIAGFVPSEFILTETDTPYLSPEPFRGKINQPKNIPYIVNCLSKIKNVEEDSLARIIRDNCLRVFSKIKA